MRLRFKMQSGCNNFIYCCSRTTLRNQSIPLIALKAPDFASLHFCKFAKIYFVLVYNIPIKFVKFFRQLAINPKNFNFYKLFRYGFLNYFLSSFVNWLSKKIFPKLTKIFRTAASLHTHTHHFGSRRMIRSTMFSLIVRIVSPSPPL